MNFLIKNNAINASDKKQWLKMVLNFKAHILILCLSISIFLFAIIFHNYLNTYVTTQSDLLQSYMNDLKSTIHQKKKLNLIPIYKKKFVDSGTVFPVLTEEEILKKIMLSFNDAIKPLLTLESTPKDIKAPYKITTHMLEFKASYDFEVFQMISYLIYTPKVFGNIRVNELQIEQTFETTPVVKGHFSYDQMSFTQ
jgi:hypothetical protein